MKSKLEESSSSDDVATSSSSSCSLSVPLLGPASTDAAEADLTRSSLAIDENEGKDSDGPPPSRSKKGGILNRLSITANSGGDSPSGRGSDNSATSKNIPLTLHYTFYSCLSRSLWSNSVLSAYVFLLRNDNPEAVGLVTAVMGLAQLIAAFPSGALADRYRRDVLLKVGSLVGAVGIVVTSLSVVGQSYPGLCTALAVWGVFFGIVQTSSSALFADSIREGGRSRLYTERLVLQQVAGMVGPGVALVMFCVLGDEWTVGECAFVIVAAQIVAVPAVVVLCFFSDDYAVKETAGATVEEQFDDDDEEEGRRRGDVLRQRLLLEDDDDEESLSAVPFTGTTGHTNENGDTYCGRAITEGDNEQNANDMQCCCFTNISQDRYIAIMVATADILSGLAAGMSIRYFPIFFLDNLHLEPAYVQALYIASPLCMSILSKLGQYGSRYIGRCQMTVVFKWTGVFFMLTMMYTYNQNLPPWIICVAYVLRTAFMNSTSALTKSVLMDAVPRKERGKWSALESVNMFSWSGSAAVGGYLVATEGIVFNFHVTAGMQLLATVPLIVLFRKVPPEKPRGQ